MPTEDISYKFPIMLLPGESTANLSNSTIPGISSLFPPEKRTYRELIQLLIEYLYYDSCKKIPPFSKEVERGKFEKCWHREDVVKWCHPTVMEDGVFTLQSFDPAVRIRVEDNKAVVTFGDNQEEFTKENDGDTFGYIEKIYEMLEKFRQKEIRMNLVETIDQIRQGNQERN